MYSLPPKGGVKAISIQATGMNADRFFVLFREGKSPPCLTLNLQACINHVIKQGAEGVAETEVYVRLEVSRQL